MTAAPPTSFKNRLMYWLEERWAYLRLVVSFLLPGVRPYEFKQSDSGPPGDMNDWDDDQLELVIVEGRRQLDGQIRMLENLRTRAQVLFTTALALSALLVRQADTFQLRIPQVQDVLLGFGIFAAAYSALGGAALVVVRATFGVIDASDLSRKPVDAASEGSNGVKRQLAREYAAAVKPGSRTLNTRLTLFFEAAVWLLAAGGLAAALFLFF